MSNSPEEASNENAKFPLWSSPPVLGALVIPLAAVLTFLSFGYGGLARRPTASDVPHRGPRQGGGGGDGGGGGVEEEWGGGVGKVRWGRWVGRG